LESAKKAPENWCLLVLFRPKWTKLELFFGRESLCEKASDHFLYFIWQLTQGLFDSFYFCHKNNNVEDFSEKQ